MKEGNLLKLNKSKLRSSRLRKKLMLNKFQIVYTHLEIAEMVAVQVVAKRLLQLEAMIQAKEVLETKLELIWFGKIFSRELARSKMIEEIAAFLTQEVFKAETTFWKQLPT